MYYIKKKLTVSAAHRLFLPYPSPCTKIHGHNRDIIVFCKSESLNESGMVLDFSEISAKVNELDHKNLNEVLDFNPTAENIAKYLCENIPFCYKVTVIESENNEATYER